MLISAEGRNVWSCTCTPPACLNGGLRGENSLVRTFISSVVQVFNMLALPQRSF